MKRYIVEFIAVYRHKVDGSLISFKEIKEIFVDGSIGPFHGDFIRILKAILSAEGPEPLALRIIDVKRG